MIFAAHELAQVYRLENSSKLPSIVKNL